MGLRCNSVGPICLGLGHNVSVTDYTNSVRNVTKGKQRVYIAISVGPIAHFGYTKTLRRETERLQSHLGETEIPIGVTDLPRVCGSGYDI